MRYKIVRNKYKIRILDILFVPALMFLLPNDYTNMFFGLDNLLVGISLICVFYCVLKHYPSLLAYLKYYYIFFLPDFIDSIYSIVFGTFGLSNIYAIFQKVLVYCLCICFFKGLYDKDRIEKLEKVVFLILFFTAISIYFFKASISYTASGGRVYFIFEGDIAKLLLVAFLLILENESLTKMAIIIRMIVYLSLIFYLVSVNSITYVLVSVLFIIMLLLSKFKQIERGFKYYKIIIFTIIVVYCIVLTGLGNEVLANLFNKSITLSGRTQIWNNLYDIIKDNFIFGTNLVSDDYRQISGMLGGTHAHNQLIQLLVSNGVVGTSCYLFMLIKLFKMKSSNFNEKKYIYYKMYLICILIMGLTTISFNPIFYLISLSYYHDFHINRDINTRNISC